MLPTWALFFFAALGAIQSVLIGRSAWRDFRAARLERVQRRSARRAAGTR